MAALPDWCTPLPGALRMRAIDRWAIEDRGVAGVDLMERAGLALARAVEERAPNGPVAVLCGKGNNGGDGLVAARVLREAGREVRVLCTGPLAELSGDALVNLERLPGAPPLESAFSEQAGDRAPGALDDAAVIVDALLGTGFEGAPRGAVARAIAAVNEAAADVVSADVPSGVAASTGVVEGGAVRASVTVTFHAAKPGHWIAPGKLHRGELREVDIGVPRDWSAAVPDGAMGDGGREGEDDGGPVGLIEAAVAVALPRRTAVSTKFTSGYVLVCGGSVGLSGAPRMCAAAAIRAGAGYVTACVPASLQAQVAGALSPEVMTRGLADSEGALSEEAVEGLVEATARGGVLALGTGLGRSPGALRFARAVIARLAVPAVLDADGLNAFAGRLDELAAHRAPLVLTPHAGELGRLHGVPAQRVEHERLRYARQTAARVGAVCVLKGDDTIVAEPGGTAVVSRGESPALAGAGTGDVLTGVIAALMAAGVEPFGAAAAGVWLHTEAGREAARRAGLAEGVIASDVIAALPAARAGAAAAANATGWQPPSRRGAL